MNWSGHRRGRGRPPHPDILTPAEWRVLELVREGLSNGEIATRLDVSVNTVRTHVSRILAKTGARDRVALASWDGEPEEASRSILARLRALAPLEWLRGASGATSWVAGASLVVVLGVLAVVAISNLQGSEDEEPPFVAPPPATATVVGSPPTAMPTATPIPTAPPRPANVVWIVEAATGNHTEVYRGEDGQVLYWQRVAPDGTGFWVTVRSEGYSVRYGWDGTEQERLDAPHGVVESPSGRWRAYDANDGGQHRLVVEGADRQFVFDDYAWSVVYSPDEERIAFLHVNDTGYMFRLSMVDLATGEQRELVSEIGGCECDGGPTPTWSPSSRYLAYTDFGAYPPDASGERPGGGVFILDLESDEELEVTAVPSMGWMGWEPDRDVFFVQPQVRTDLDDGTWRIEPEQRLVLIDAATGDIVGERELPDRPIRDGVYESPDGQREAIIRRLRYHPITGVATWEIAIHDVAQDVTTVIGQIEGEWPQATWNEAGTHFVVHTHPDL